MRNEEIKAVFEELYRLRNGNLLKDFDEIIYAVVPSLSSGIVRKQASWGGVKVGIALAQET